MAMLTTCARCGAEIELDRRAIVAGSWHLCAACRGDDAGDVFPEPAAEDSGVRV